MLIEKSRGLRERGRRADGGGEIIGAKGVRYNRRGSGAAVNGF